MSRVGQRERVTQNRVVEVFEKRLGYEYLGNWQDRTGNSHIEEPFLRAFLRKQGYEEGLIGRALFELGKVAGDQAKSLYEINKAVYGLLRYGVPVKPDVGQNTVTVELIDWKQPLNNHFAIAEEVTIKAQNSKRPDMVLYVNGIALGVLELKRAIVSVSEGIRQNLDNQQKTFIQPFFTTIQLVMAGNDSQGLRYGVIETPEKYYLTWKEEGDRAADVTNVLDRQLIQLCHKERLLELVHDFIVFDAGTKKICRHNQYFGVKAAQKRVKRREGGILWHTQGSGKSLMMVWLAKWIRENVTDARVLIITDRTELDEQIEKVFLGVNEAIYRTRSGQDLITQLAASTPWLICSLVHKFGHRGEADVDGYLKELMDNLHRPELVQGDLYVYIDECHRTQSGKLHNAMKALLPHAMFIGFTGTPLLKADKQKSIEVFGSYIHTYKFNEAVADEVVLDLRYEAREIEQNLSSPQKIDRWFQAKTKGLNDIALAQLKRRWGTMQRVLSSKSRLEQIVDDIVLDMALNERLKNGRGNAILVSDSIYNACKFYELFTSRGFDKCAIVTSYKPTPADIKGENTGEGLTERLRQYEIYQKMLAGKESEAFEREVKHKFIHEPGQMKLLIVVAKLLTGFDAPSATYLYIDKRMEDHALFQAICRVNRLDGEDKEYGYIIDYRDLFRSLEKSIMDYTSEVFAGYEREDVAGLLSNRLQKAKERLEEAREAIHALCEAVAPPKDTPAYLHYFCAHDTADKEALQENEAKRLTLYKLTVKLIRAYANLANEMPEAGYTPQDITRIKADVRHYEQLRQEVKLASGDYIDLKLYEPAMRALLDMYIRAEDSQNLSTFNDLTLIQLVVERGAAAIDALPASIRANSQSVAETIENNLRKVIIDERPINPRYYENMSDLLDELIQERKAQTLEYEEYLAQIVALSQKVAHPEQSKRYPDSLNRPALRALYDNLAQNEDLALKIDQTVRSTKRDGWRGHRIKERQLKYAIREEIPDSEELERIFDLVKKQYEY